jgi:C-terminal processing protease CtpA/Prc
MKRFPLDEFKPIPDQEPNVTTHLRAMLQDAIEGTSHADDYTATMWEEISSKQQQIKADIKRLGDFVSMTLVDHMVVEERRSYRYRLEFSNASILQHYVFEGQSKLVSGGTEYLEWKPDTKLAETPSTQISGIGVALTVDGENIVVNSIVPDSPAAAQKDIHVGDRILAVAQETGPAVQVQSGKLRDVVALIRGPAGTTVRLTTVASGEHNSSARVVSVVRGELKALPGQ